MGRYQDLKNLYDVEKTIGSGGFAKVKLATHLITGDKVALKIMDKAALGDDYHRVKLELDALKSISHHHICKLYQVIETPTHFFLVLEYCSGGELFDYIVDKKRLSEAESRTFFRQILSAVAYMHMKGYAHRDLKPENILLDSDMNLKLIDFGLCAKPKEGISSYLKTSCGSPTYAAPELIKGQSYLGSETDVWSMGVLLYALMCGCLPFDADTIESLYKKILAGEYAEPPWLSELSKGIIRSMLQTDPKRRITVDQLCIHPWITMGYLEPVSPRTLHLHREKNSAVIETMANHYMVTAKSMWEFISKWSYDYYTATYLVLLHRYYMRQPLVIKQSYGTIRNRLTMTRQRCNEIKDTGIKADTVSPLKQQNCTPSQTPITDNNKKGDDKENNKKVTTRTVRKRLYPSDDSSSPIPVKMTPGKKPVIQSNNSTSATSSPTTPGSKLLNTIEKKLSHVRNVLTPRKRNNHFLGPAVLKTKNLCNVSTTRSTNPDYILEELSRALKEKDIITKKKGYRLRGWLEGIDSKGKGCFFELEVCLIETSKNSKNIVGIRRKRLKGDAWAYKRICEQILSMTQIQSINSPST